MTSPGPSFAPNPSDPSRSGGTWRIRGIGWERRGFTQLALEIYSSRPAAFQFVEHLRKALGNPTAGPELLNIGELSDSDGEVPTYTVWTFLPDEIPNVRETCRVFPRETR